MQFTYEYLTEIISPIAAMTFHRTAYWQPTIVEDLEYAYSYIMTNV